MKKEQESCNILCINEEAVTQVQKEMLTEKENMALANTFKVLGDPTRIKLIQALSLKELCVCDLAYLLNMTQSAVSHQLRVLRNTRIVKYRREGKIVYYSLDDEHIVNLFKEGLEHIKHD